jgi:mannitol/fructose-specific phosphotransferase system IIA component (Ntr-type)
MKITFEVDGRIASIEDLDEEFNSIHQALQICVSVLNAAGFQEESIKKGIKQLNEELNK